MFEFDGELKASSKNWLIVYSDNEGDIMLVGDDPWQYVLKPPCLLFMPSLVSLVYWMMHNFELNRNYAFMIQPLGMLLALDAMLTSQQIALDAILPTQPTEHLEMSDYAIAFKK